MADNDVPGAWPVWTPRTWLSGFKKRITEQCYKQNIKALGLIGLMVSEKKAFVFSQGKYMRANGTLSGTIFDPRYMIGRTYVEHRITLHYT